MPNTRQVFLIRVLAFLIFIGSIFGLYDMIVKGDFENALGLVAILFVSGFTFFYMGKSDKSRKDPDVFLAQLKENKNIILTGGWKYGDHLITAETQITQYFFTYSFITASFKIPSCFYIVNEENTSVINFIYSFSSLILGWWAFPHGPIYTISALSNNLKGGNKLRVGDVI